MHSDNVLGSPGPNERAEVSAHDLAVAARILEGASTFDDTLNTICTLAVQITHADHAGVTLQTHDRLQTRAATSGIPHQVDQLQYDLHEGPCVGVTEGSLLIRADDLLDEERWPRFAPAAIQATGIRSMLAYRLMTSEGTAGALNLYAAEPKTFDDSDEQVFELFAAHAAVAIRAAAKNDHAENLAKALHSNRRIGVAVGILMTTQGGHDDDALEMMKTASQQKNVKVADLAERIIYTGIL